MEVGVGISGEIVVDGEIDTLNVDTAAEDIGGDADTLVEFFELLVAFDTEDGLARMSISKATRLTALPD